MGDSVDDVFGELPLEVQSVIAVQPRRMFLGFWSTKELSTLCGVKSAAIANSVYRKQLTPISRIRGQMNYYTDAEVARYLMEKRGVGRPKHPKQHASQA